MKAFAMPAMSPTGVLTGIIKKSVAILSTRLALLIIGIQFVHIILPEPPKALSGESVKGDDNFENQKETYHRLFSL